MKTTFIFCHYLKGVKLITSLLILSMAIAASAQDVIYLKDHTEINSTVIEISDEIVSYQLFDETNDSIYTVLKPDF